VLKHAYARCVCMCTSVVCACVCDVSLNIEYCVFACMCFDACFVKQPTHLDGPWPVPWWPQCQGQLPQRTGRSAQCVSTRSQPRAHWPHMKPQQVLTGTCWWKCKACKFWVRHVNYGVVRWYCRPITVNISSICDICGFQALISGHRSEIRACAGLEVASKYSSFDPRRHWCFHKQLWEGVHVERSNDNQGCSLWSLVKGSGSQTFTHVNEFGTRVPSPVTACRTFKGSSNTKATRGALPLYTSNLSHLPPCSNS